ncbi:MAG: hypothetical protein ACXQS8_03880 [Candidatus Helarchaeales archaeon]
MLFCNRCKKKVVLYGVSHGAVPEEYLTRIFNDFNKQDVLVLFNPPLIGPYRCPACGTTLEMKKDE